MEKTGALFISIEYVKKIVSEIFEEMISAKITNEKASLLLLKRYLIKKSITTLVLAQLGMEGSFKLTDVFDSIVSVCEVKGFTIDFEV